MIAGKLEATLKVFTLKRRESLGDARSTRVAHPLYEVLLALGVGGVGSAHNFDSSNIRVDELDREASTHHLLPRT